MSLWMLGAAIGCSSALCRHADSLLSCSHLSYVALVGVFLITVPLCHARDYSGIVPLGRHKLLSIFSSSATSVSQAICLATGSSQIAGGWSWTFNYAWTHILQVTTFLVFLFLLMTTQFVSRTIAYAVKNLRLALLKMGKGLPETCWFDLGDQ
jgi:hypothetical protein